MAVTARSRTRFSLGGLLLLLALAGFLSRSWADETNAVAPALNAESTRSALLLQEQLRATQLAIEKLHDEARAEAASNAAVLAQRLEQMEKNLSAQRVQDINTLAQNENHTILLTVSILVSLTLLALVVTGYFQWTAMNRFTAAAAGLSASRSLPALTLAEEASAPSPLMLQSSARFMEVIERMEKRLHQLETTNKAAPLWPEHGPGNGAATDAAAAPLALAAAVDVADKVSLLVGKSQTLIKMDKPEAALRILDEALLIDPNNVDIFIKKGAALERLHRAAEAIRCFDRAIAIDGSITMAYLRKGALFNRMERYKDALECYEQALKTNPKSHAGDPREISEPFSAGEL